MPALQTTTSRKPNRTNKALDILNANVSRIRNSDAWRDALALRRRLHRYSFQNAMLIHLQRPDATMVAGYGRWQELGRQVRKGEKGISILAPMVKKIEREDGTTDKRLFGFKAASVFDISQTDGEPIPEPPRPEPLTADDPRASSLYDALAAYALTHGSVVSLVSRDELGDAHGCYHVLTRAISVAADLAPVHRLKTLVHEIAHAHLHGKAIPDRSLAEVEAESVAYLVLDALGIDSGGYSFHYVAHWAGEAEDLLKAGDAAVRTADAIIAAVEEGGTA